jgi:hypothetical protein
MSPFLIPKLSAGLMINLRGISRHNFRSFNTIDRSSDQYVLKLDDPRRLNPDSGSFYEAVLGVKARRCGSVAAYRAKSLRNCISIPKESVLVEFALVIFFGLRYDLRLWSDNGICLPPVHSARFFWHYSINVRR